MAQILTQEVVVRVSKLVKDSDNSNGDALTADQQQALVELIEGAAGEILQDPTLIVEVYPA